MILAGKALEIDSKAIKRFEAEMKYQMEMKGEQQARKAMNHFKQKKEQIYFLPINFRVISYAPDKRRLILNR
jgi:RNase P/RNase MRP subunit p30